MRNIALKIAYDGTRYYGWQKTHDGPSIEQELENALTPIIGHTPILQAASRTDRGVHADGQIVTFTTEKRNSCAQFQHSLNALLPEDIRVMNIEEKELLFHPTLDALSKTYHYKIALGKTIHPTMRLYCWHYPFDLNISLMQEAASYLIGTHNFAAFRNQRKDLIDEDTIRQIFALSISQEVIDKAIKVVHVKINGNNFLYKMARNIVGTLVYAGAGKLSLQEVQALLIQHDRTKGGVTAPAHGLTLHYVHYPQSDSLQ